MQKSITTLPAVVKSKAVANRFLWRDQHGDFHQIEKMETRHLFFTLRMIWNHTMPEDARSGYYKRYAFSPFYTQSYVAEAIRCIILELFSRNDLKPTWKYELDRFAEYLNRKPLIGVA